MVEGNEELFLIIAIQSLPCLLNLDFLFTSSTTDYHILTEWVVKMRSVIICNLSAIGTGVVNTIFQFCGVLFSTNRLLSKNVFLPVSATFI